MTASEPFGCERCFRSSAEEAAEAKPSFVEVSRLVDELHLIVRILACPHCGQRCVSVFTEMIDWSQGDDAQYISVLPVTDDESQKLISQGEQVELRLIEALGRNRLYLQIDHPTGKPRRVQWAGHLMIGPHD